MLRAIHFVLPAAACVPRRNILTYTSATLNTVLGQTSGIQASQAATSAQAAKSPALRVVAMSDTHGFHRAVRVPSGDCLIHCGDVTTNFDRDKLVDFCNWFVSFPHRVKLIISGNHESSMSLQDAVERAAIEHSVNVPSFLDCREELIDGQYRFFGLPFSQSTSSVRIPENLHVLVSHVPPQGYLDISKRDGTHAGSKTLRDSLEGLQHPPRLHAFGHIHEGHGIKMGDQRIPTTLYANVAIANDGSAVRAARPCTVIDIPADPKLSPEVLQEM